MHQVRVLLVGPSPEIVGGQSVQALRLLDALRNTPGIDARFQPIDPRLGGALRPLQKIKFVRTAITETIYTAQLLGKSRHFDVLHVFTAGNTSFLLTFIPTVMAKIQSSIPLILNYHDGRAADHFGRSGFSASLARKADRVIVPSAFLVDVLGRFGIPASAVGNIIESSRFHYRERAPVEPRFLHNRGLEAHYNAACSIRAFGLIQARYRHASLVMAHDGPQRKELETLTGALALQNVRFVGSVNQARMSQLYDEAGIYLMSPNVDNMPLSVLECFASGLPVVSTAAGGVPYLVHDGKTGLIVPLDDHHAMAAASLRLLDEPGLAVRLARNGSRECQKYTPEASAKRWAELYRELSSQSPGWNPG